MCLEMSILGSFDLKQVLGGCARAKPGSWAGLVLAASYYRMIWARPGILPRQAEQEAHQQTITEHNEVMEKHQAPSLTAY